MYYIIPVIVYRRGKLRYLKRDLYWRFLFWSRKQYRYLICLIEKDIRNRISQIVRVWTLNRVFLFWGIRIGCFRFYLSVSKNDRFVRLPVGYGSCLSVWIYVWWKDSWFCSKKCNHLHHKSLDSYCLKSKFQFFRLFHTHQSLQYEDILPDLVPFY